MPSLADSTPDQAAARAVVLDTNVLVSLYVFADSRLLPLRAALEDGRWRALTRADCLAEFRRVLGYPQFSLDEPAQQAAHAAYSLLAVPVATMRPGDLPRCSDRDDQKFLELARDGAASFLVTADKALLKLARRSRSPYRGQRTPFEIITPDAALGLVAEPGSA